VTNNLSVPLFDRNLHGGSAPGSTVEALHGAAGLDTGLRRPRIASCPPASSALNGPRTRLRRRARARPRLGGLKESIAQSVNTYYYQLALDMGVDRFDEYMGRYGFGKPTESTSSARPAASCLRPNTSRSAGSRMVPGRLVNAGIGQGLWKVTMLQLVQATESMADSGLRHQLHLVRAARNGYANPWLPLPQPDPVRISTAPSTSSRSRRRWWAVVHGAHGHRARHRHQFALPDRRQGPAPRRWSATRTTCAWIRHSLPLNLRHQALFIAFAPADDPRIAVAVVVEHGGFGASSAAPIARAIMDAYLLRPRRRPQPLQARPLSSTGAHAAAPASGTPPRAPPTSAPLLVPPAMTKRLSSRRPPATRSRNRRRRRHDRGRARVHRRAARQDRLAAAGRAVRGDGGEPGGAVERRRVASRAWSSRRARVSSSAWGAMVLLSRVPPARLRIWTPIVFASRSRCCRWWFAFGSGRSARLWINLGVFYCSRASCSRSACR
jgi:penicillin-binding protein 2